MEIQANPRMNPKSDRTRCSLQLALLVFLLFGSPTITCGAPGRQAQESEGEIVANLAGGRVIVHVAKDDLILFATIDHPVETGAPPPRLVSLDTTHIGILLGASEWREPAAPKPIRLDRDYQSVGRHETNYANPTGA